MAQHRVHRVPGATVHLVFTDASDGDLAVDVPAEELRARRAAVAPGEWTWLRQVHGADVVEVARPGDGSGSEADAAVTSAPGAVLAVHTADCAGVLLWDEAGATGAGGALVAAVHAGWRGLEAGVLQAAVAAMREQGGDELRWALGPCISPDAYEFGEEELDRLVERYGPSLRSTTSDGRPALDLRAGVAAALADAGAPATPGPAGSDVPCTATGGRWFSWRARRDSGRQAALVWTELDAVRIEEDP